MNRDQRQGQDRGSSPVYVLANVRCWHQTDKHALPLERQLLTDAVDKVGNEQRAGNNRIQVPRFFESMLRSRLLS